MKLREQGMPEVQVERRLLVLKSGEVWLQRSELVP